MSRMFIFFIDYNVHFLSLFFITTFLSPSATHTDTKPPIMEEWTRQWTENPDQLDQLVVLFIRDFDAEAFTRAWQQAEDHKKRHKAHSAAPTVLSSPAEPMSKAKSDAVRHPHSLLSKPAGKAKSHMIRRGIAREGKDKDKSPVPPAELLVLEPPAESKLDSKSKLDPEDQGPQVPFFEKHTERILKFWQDNASAKKFKAYTARGLNFLSAKLTPLAGVAAGDAKRAQDAKLESYQIVLQHLSTQIFKNLVQTLYSYIKWVTKLLARGVQKLTGPLFTSSPSPRLSKILLAVADKIDSLLLLTAKGLDWLLYILAQILALMITWPPLFSLILQIVNQLLQASCSWIQKTRGLSYVRTRTEAWKREFETPEDEKTFIQHSLLYSFSEVGSVLVNHLSEGKLDKLWDGLDVVFKGVMKRILHGILQGSIDGLACLLRFCVPCCGVGECVASCFGSSEAVRSDVKQKPGLRKILVDEGVDVLMESFIVSVSQAGMTMRGWVFLTADNVHRLGKILSLSMKCLTDPTYREATAEEALEDPLVLSSVQASHDVQRIESSSWWNVTDLAHRQATMWLKKLTGHFFLGPDNDPFSLDLFVQATSQAGAGALDSKSFGLLWKLVATVIMGAPVARQHLYPDSRTDEARLGWHQNDLGEASALVRQPYSDMGRKYINALPLIADRSTQERLSGLFLRLLSERPSTDMRLWSKLRTEVKRLVADLSHETIVTSLDNLLTFCLQVIRDSSARKKPSENSGVSSVISTISRYEEWIRTYLHGRSEHPPLPTRLESYQIFALYLYLEARERQRPYQMPASIDKRMLMMDVFETSDHALDKHAARLVLWDLAGTDSFGAMDIKPVAEAMNLQKMEMDIPPSAEIRTIAGAAQFFTERGETRQSAFAACVRSIQESGDRYKQFVLDRLEAGASVDRESGGELQLVHDFIHRYVHSKVRYITAQQDRYLMSDIKGGEWSRSVGKVLFDTLSKIMQVMTDLNRIRYGASAIHYKKLLDVEHSIHQQVAAGVQAVRLLMK